MNPGQFISSIKEFFAQTGFTHAVLGVSGGIDSALTCTLLVKALGAENVTALLMPEEGVSSPGGLDDAKALAESLGINYHIISINDHLTSFEDLPWTQNKTAHINNKARLRMMILYNYANTHGCLVAGTSNKTEILLGYGTKHGDAAADLYIIGSLLKKTVYALARELDIPKPIIDKAPSAELYEGQTDEDELGMTYHEIDSVLEEIDLGYEMLVQKHDRAVVDKIFKKIHENAHKGHTPVISLQH